MSRQDLSDRILQRAQVLEALRREESGEHDATRRVAEEVASLQDDIEELSAADVQMRARQDDLARTQSRLDRELARMRRLSGWAPLAWLVTLPNGRITEIGAGASAVFGLAPDAMVGRALTELVAPLDTPRIAALLSRVHVDHDEPLSDIVGVHDETGCRVRVAPEHDAHGERTGLLWLFEPIPEAEQAAVPQLADDTEFLSRLAHELRNPLAPVRAAVDLWRERGDELTPEQRQWTIDVVARQADHLARVVDDLLDVAELSRRDVSLRRTVVDLRDVVEEAQEVMRTQSHHVDVELPDEPIRVEGDAARLRRVVVDLLGHALKSAPKHGSLFVQVDGDHEHAFLLVRDEGSGPDLLDTAFGGDGEGPSPSDSPPGGPLQRLALVRRLVELHGGTVAVHDMPGGIGREVTVCLPRIVAANQTAPVHPMVGNDLERPMRVLVVDDNVDAAEMLALLLEARGLETTLAFDGQGALAAFEWSRPDAVLLDLALPDMDGLDVARQLQAREPAVPLIALTGYGDEATRKRTAKLGFAHHLTKPVDVTAVCRMLDDVARRS